MKATRLIFPLALLILPLLNAAAQVQVGADQIETILEYVAGRQVGVTANHTSILSDPNRTHLVDTLLTRGVQIKRLYTPEHGLRGTADAGASVKSGRDTETGLPIVSLYGNKKKPTPTDLAEIDLMIFDLQDVGTRFYTYISTLTYLMEACSEQGIPLLILDRPNPNDTIDGPLCRLPKYRSFVSLLPIPVLHGLTLGEAAQMINGEGWLKGKIKVALNIIATKGWRHGESYSLPVPPSPNLRSDKAIAYYPTLCYIEGTSWSEGRGTKHPFEQIGYPKKGLGTHQFIPVATQGATNPKHKGKVCYGPSLDRYTWHKGINLEVLIDAYRLSEYKGIDFITRPSYFDLMAGNSELRQQLQSHKSAQAIRDSWQRELKEYGTLRAKYLLYRDYPALQ